MGNEVSSQKTEEATEKHPNGAVNGHTVDVSRTQTPPSVSAEVTKSSLNQLPPSSSSFPAAGVEKHLPTETDARETVATPAPDQTLDGDESEPSVGSKSNFFDKLFSKKSDVQPKETDEHQHEEDATTDQVVAEVRSDQQMATRDLQEDAELGLTQKEVQSSSPLEAEQTQTEENPVMNFFKTLVSPSKPSKAAAAGDPAKDQTLKEAAGVSSAGHSQEVDAAKGKMAPPPPPEPPKVDSKGEAASKKEEPKEGGKEAEPSTKPKATKESPFSKLFKPKTDASKTATLEAAAKLEPAPVAKEEEKKAEKKSSPFASLFKPKVLLDQVAAKIQSVASASGIAAATRPAEPTAEPSKAPPAAAAPPDAPQGTKAKEETKAAPPSAPPAPPAPPVDKSGEKSVEASPTVPRKEKRNSIQLFFKNLGQKRQSDAGVPPEAVTVPPLGEKAK